MKSKVLNRPMFLDPENVGIMQGFKDPEYEDQEEEYGPMMGYSSEMESESEGEDYEEEDDDAIERSPSSPEILMNNLRGDMRSVDARLQELANLVGMEVAADTPMEVLALLQPVLAAQEQGIASLPAGLPQQPMGTPSSPPPPPMGAGQQAPDMSLLPPDLAMMPQEPPPMDQVPINMANGGLVQRFSDGSDERGVTQDDAPFPSTPRDPSVARNMMLDFRARSQAVIPTLAQEMQTRLPEYQQAIGAGDRSMTQSQILFDIAQAGLNLAAGTDAGGRPVRPGASFASRLAGAAQALPERISARVGQLQQDEKAVRLAALKAAESSIEDQRKVFAKFMQGESPFGKGSWEWGVVNKPGLMKNWAEGKVTPEEDILVQSAVAKLSQPRIEMRSDPVTGQVMQVQVPAVLPPFVSEAINRRGGGVPTPTTGATPGRVAAPAPAAPEPLPPNYAPPGTPRGTAGDRELDQPSAPAPVPAPAAPEQKKEAPASAMPPVVYNQQAPTMFNLADKGTGLISVPKAFLASVPVIGEFVEADKEIQAKTFLSNAVNQINRAIASSPRFAEGERKQIQQELDLFPKALDRPDAYRQRIIGLDTLLLELRANAYEQGYQNPNLGPEDIRRARLKLQEIDQIRSLTGAPPRVFSQQERDKLPDGAYYLWQGSQLAKKKPR